ncbi:MAG: NAD(P)-dependent oxidoreductase [Candidatus Saccharimonadales bacterium]
MSEGKNKIVFFDTHGGDSSYFRRAFKNVFKSEVITTEEPLNTETVSKYQDVHIVSVFVTSKVSSDVIKKLPNLELIAARSTGHDHIDVVAAKKNHVLTSTVPTYGESTVAEYTFMLLLTVARRLSESIEQIEGGVIDHPQLTGLDLEGKTLGILGCGKIGKHVAKIAKGFGMRVIGHDKFPIDDENIEEVSLDTLLEDSDVISLHLPLTDETKHIINKTSLAKTKKGVIIVNTARGELIKTSDLIDALYSAQVAGAGLDVLEGEELLRFDEDIALLHPGASKQDLLLRAEHSVLQRMPNVVLTPHNAFNSQEALTKIRRITAENIKQFLLNEPQNIA